MERAAKMDFPRGSSIGRAPFFTAQLLSDYLPGVANPLNWSLTILHLTPLTLLEVGKNGRCGFESRLRTMRHSPIELDENPILLEIVTDALWHLHKLGTLVEYHPYLRYLRPGEKRTAWRVVIKHKEFPHRNLALAELEFQLDRVGVSGMLPGLRTEPKSFSANISLSYANPDWVPQLVKIFDVPVPAINERYEQFYNCTEHIS